MNIRNSKQQKLQQGFGAAGVVALIVIVGIIGFTGWFVYHSSQKTNDVLSQTTGPDTSTPSTPVSDSAKPPTPASNANVSPVKTTFSKVPKDLQDVIFGYTKVKAPSCVKGTDIVDLDGKPTDQDVSYTINADKGSAFTGIGCDGGSVNLFAKSDGKWQQIAGTQLAFDCDTLKTHDVPSALLEVAFAGQDSPSQCLDGQTQTVVAYKN